MDKPLQGKIAVVAGATRGAGRGIARMLGEAGAIVYCSGRSTTGNLSDIGRQETIDETAVLVTEAGGHGIAVRTDHSRAEDVESLFARVKDQHGQLDLLVNDIGGENLAEWKPFWEADLALGFSFLDTAVRTHILTSRFAVPLMLEQKAGLIIEITDGDHAGYRGNLFYDLVKNQLIRFAFALASELKSKGINVLALTPGFLRSEMMLDNLGVTEATWMDAAEKAQGFCESETPCFVGRAVAVLAADPNIATKSGGVFSSWDLAKEYNFDDIDGRRPDFMGYVETSISEILDNGGPRTDEDKYWVSAWQLQLKDDVRWRDLMARIEAIQVQQPKVS
ncbi:MAG: SDR family oxidoreductase [bacterium]|nr:SDR family oxidoreductase [Gammaproteobacteria bacterium]